jgi:hypothetical protein
VAQRYGFGGYAAEYAAHGGENRSLTALESKTPKEWTVKQPNRIWWARPSKLCALERPGGGGRSHRPERRDADIAYLVDNGVRVVISTMTTRHNLGYYEEAGLEWRHVPVASCDEGAEALEQLLPLLRRETRRRGAVAVHGNRHTDFVAALCAAHLHEARGVAPEEALAAAVDAGLTVTPEAAALLGVPYEAVQPRSRMASSTASGLSVTT